MSRLFWKRIKNRIRAWNHARLDRRHRRKAERPNRRTVLASLAANDTSVLEGLIYLVEAAQEERKAREGFEAAEGRLAAMEKTVNQAVLLLSHSQATLDLLARRISRLADQRESPSAVSSVGASTSASAPAPAGAGAGVTPRYDFAPEIRLFKILKRVGLEPRVVYDIGAARGEWSTVVADGAFPDATYHLFEPLVDVEGVDGDDLRRNVASHPAFTVHPVALGAQEGTVDFWTSAEPLGSTAIDMEGVEGWRKRTVRMERLDAFAERNLIQLPDLIKIDVQGLELEIFREAARCLKHATVVQAEVWTRRSYGPRTPLLHEVIEFMDGHGFDLVELGGERYYERGHALAGLDAFFAKRDWTGMPPRALPAGHWNWDRGPESDETSGCSEDIVNR